MRAVHGCTGTGIRVGYGEGYTGYYPAMLLEEVPVATSEAGPGSPTGAGVGGWRGPGVLGTAAGTGF